MAQLLQGSELPVSEPAPGIVRRVVAGQELMLAAFTIAAGQKMPAHSHPHEQIGYVVSGRARFRVGDVVRELAAGGVYAVPSGVEHEVEVLGSEDATFIDVFTPLRQDFLS
ncbi:MAG: cupin domain-containing protein [Anaerolineae bacterium]